LGFTRHYKCHRLVYCESFDSVHNAIAREKQIKRWSRWKKAWLIEQKNPTWEDLAAEWFANHRYQPEKSRSLDSFTDSPANRFPRSG
jgi:hypothetical protein